MEKRKFHISIVLIPDAMTSNLSSIFEVLRTMSRLNTFDESIPATPLFDVEFVASSHADIEMAGGLTLKAHRAIADIEQTDIISAIR